MCPRFTHEMGLICAKIAPLKVSYFKDGEVIFFFLSGKIGVLTNRGKI
jgi:hypothetical protein